MKIAVTYENGQIFQHFGHTAQFKLYEIENEKYSAPALLIQTEAVMERLPVFWFQIMSAY